MTDDAEIAIPDTSAAVEPAVESEPVEEVTTPLAVDEPVATPIAQAQPIVVVTPDIAAWAEAVTSHFINSSVVDLTGSDVDKFKVISEAYVSLLINYGASVGDENVISKAAEYFDKLEIIKNG